MIELSGLKDQILILFLIFRVYKWLFRRSFNLFFAEIHFPLGSLVILDNIFYIAVEVLLEQLNTFDGCSEGGLSREVVLVGSFDLADEMPDVEDGEIRPIKFIAGSQQQSLHFFTHPLPFRLYQIRTLLDFSLCYFLKTTVVKLFFFEILDAVVGAE